MFNFGWKDSSWHIFIFTLLRVGRIYGSLPPHWSYGKFGMYFDSDSDVLSMGKCKLVEHERLQHPGVYVVSDVCHDPEIFL